jgi:hypothetical protein
VYVVLAVVVALLAFAAGFLVATHRARMLLGANAPTPDAAEVPPPPAPTAMVAFDPIAPRGTRGHVYDDHDEPWRLRMREIGDRMRRADVAAVVFVHGTFTGDDPLSASRLVERIAGPALARAFRKTTRATALRVLGDLGVFGPEYVSLFERAIGGDLPCTTFVWSSENHHVGRASGALALVRALAMHATLAEAPRPRILVIGHSHAAQLFAIVTQLVARAASAEAFADVARVRGLDVAALDAELDLLARTRIDFVTFGAPTRYAWAEVPGFRALHLLHAPRRLGVLPAGDIVQRLGSASSDFPPLDGEERRVNAALKAALLHSPAARSLLSAPSADAAAHPYGEVVLVDYGSRARPRDVHAPRRDALPRGARRDAPLSFAARRSGDDAERPAAQHLVVAARAVAGEIERHVGEAESLAGLDDRVAVRERLVELVLADLDARHRALFRAGGAAHRVPADARLADAERVDLRLEGADLREALARDACAVREAARQARGRGLVPDRKPEELRAAAHVLFAEPGLDERAARARLLRRLEAGAIVAEVVEVRPVDDLGEAPLDLLRGADPVELALAVEAAIGVVLRVVLVLDLVRLDELVARADPLRDRDRLLALERREARAHGRHADALVAEHAVRDVEHERAVDPARVADEDRSHAADDVREPVEHRIARKGGAHPHRYSAHDAAARSGFSVDPRDDLTDRRQ